MAPSGEEDDPVIAEYDVYFTASVAEQVYLVQYPVRERVKPYDRKHGSEPQTMRIKPKSGHIETDMRINTNNNYNKYMGLKWGDAAQTAKQVHNATGTYGPASGLTLARPRASTRDNALKDWERRELDLDNDLHHFRGAVEDNKAHSKQTLGGQIIREGEDGYSRKTTQFVGAFQGDKLHLTRVNGVAQLRPQFHHIDAEIERIRLAMSRTHQDGDAPVSRIARNVKSQNQSKQERDTLENRINKALGVAEHEKWVDMQYLGEESDASFAAFREKFFLHDADEAKALQRTMDNEQYLDAINPPRHGSPTRRRKRAPKRKDNQGEVEDVEVGDAQDAQVEEGALQDAG